MVSGKDCTCQCRRHKRCRFNHWVRKIHSKIKCNHSNILIWEIPWTQEPDRLWSMGLQSWTQLSACTHMHTHTHTSNCILNTNLYSIIVFYYTNFCHETSSPKFSSAQIQRLSSSMEQTLLFQLTVNLSPQKKYSVSTR